MENLITRYRNLTVLAALLFAQVLGLAIQVKRPGENAPTRLIRVWAVDSVTPFEKGIVGFQNGTGGLWHNYFYLRGVRQENRDLKQKIQQLEIERVRLSEDAEQAHRLQALLGFKEKYIAKTIAAQVIGSSGSEQSRAIYIDKGTNDGVKPDMPVITADGVVGKVLRGVQNHVASVLLINDQTSGVGAILEKSRLQGVLRGTALGEVVLEKVMTDETVQPGERVLTSGGDRIFPKGLVVGTVTRVSPGAELFLNIRVKPAADLGRLEEVLVVSQEEDRQPVVADSQHLRAADILAQRLPSIPDQPAVTNPYAPPPPTSGLKITPATGTSAQQEASVTKAGSSGAVTTKAAALSANSASTVSSAKSTSTDTKSAIGGIAVKPATAPKQGTAIKPDKPAAVGASQAPVSVKNVQAQPKTQTVNPDLNAIPSSVPVQSPQDQPH